MQHMYYHIYKSQPQIDQNGALNGNNKGVSSVLMF